MAAYAALLSLMNIIDTLQNHPRPPISLHKNQVHLLTQNITSLQKFLEAYNPTLAYTAEADPLETRIADAAYAAEDVIESHIVDSITDDGEMINSDEVFYEAVEKVIEEMALIEKEAMLLQPHQLQTKSTPPDSSRSSSVAQVQQRRMVGADQLLFQMKDKLTSDRRDLQVIPVVGMGGSGKTALAINIYQDRLIVEHFDIRAWATISQEYSIREILALLVKQLLHRDVSQDLSVGELGDMLHKHLYGRRYLIVLDDMWSNEAWDGVRMFFPNTTDGSRIVVTTRLSILASNLPNSSSLKTNLLGEDDTWELLSKTVFGEKDCPVEYEKIGKEIGKGCKGLPLSIVVVGGLLAKSEPTIEYWEYIRENLNSIVNLEDDERYFKILYMSYKQLPVHLKPCFLYMGVFPEDEEIRTKKLVRLWVAEGFLKPISNKCMEEVALEYLEDLIGRNLVLVHELGSIGNIRKCKMHDLLRDLCVREAEKERFYTVVASPPQGIVNNAAQRRVVVSTLIWNHWDEAINTMSSMPLARTLIWNLGDSKLPQLNLRLLRILETPHAWSVACLESVHQLVNSRYINIESFYYRDSMVRFWNLQMLSDLITTTSIFDMIQIRHIESHIFDNDQLQGDNIVLGNLQTLGWLENFKCSKEIVKRIPNLKKLKIKYDRSFDEEYCLTNLIFLDKLESFSCYFCSQCRGDPLQGLISFPNSLIKLSIELNSDQCWEDILDKIGSLPLLQKLTLFGGRFKEVQRETTEGQWETTEGQRETTEGQWETTEEDQWETSDEDQWETTEEDQWETTEGQWETTEGQFRSLKCLVLYECDGYDCPLVWTTECSHFPCLERLSLNYIHELKEIPLDFAEIPTLKLVKVIGCSDSVVESAKRIVEEHVELYGEEEAALQVHVTLPKRNYTEKYEALESLASPNFHVYWE